MRNAAALADPAPQHAVFEDAPRKGEKERC
ncbi:hypothetical protein B14911_23462 [Bacillus sp. NRRL B-14911]|uniref:Uncharacterized protein n=1 Tax=Bacillus infantis NRRL B-14911 TaxID=1367477 RepID=U5LEH4_9BACI|nr:hypothetical protein N288_15535 [Bacillus infantis NRRL B-14911]EAR66566.1 hypothetical protein B14911_23462 [Bacillus sp. NRRL B-14911]